MLTIYSQDHQLHRGRFELADGKLLPCFETPERAEWVLEAVRQANLGDIVAPDDFGLDPILRVHDAAFVEFLQQAWDLWTAAGRDSDALPLALKHGSSSTLLVSSRGFGHPADLRCRNWPRKPRAFNPTGN